MAIRSTNPYTRIEQDIKVKSESILDEVKLSFVRPVDISTLSEAEFHEELEKGYADMQTGQTKNAKPLLTFAKTMVYDTRSNKCIRF